MTLVNSPLAAVGWVPADAVKDAAREVAEVPVLPHAAPALLWCERQ